MNGRLEPSASSTPVAEAIPLEIIYQDDQLVVVNKPAGMVVHPARGHSSGTLVHALLGLGGTWSAVGGQARPGIVHRLDRGTSGLILAARTDHAHRSLSSQLAERRLRRSYLALVRGRPSPLLGILEGPIGRDPRQRLRMAVVEKGRWARTRYQVLESRGGHTLVRCELDTGRTHQIRVHLAALGHPVTGDELYGGGTAGGRPMLHAQRIAFVHPLSGAEMSFEIDLAPDMAAFWAGLQ